MRGAPCGCKVRCCKELCSRLCPWRVLRCAWIGQGKAGEKLKLLGGIDRFTDGSLLFVRLHPQVYLRSWS